MKDKEWRLSPMVSDTCGTVYVSQHEHLVQVLEENNTFADP
jgi:N-dimethylarginine dimethylaminohydrolase